MQIGSYRADDNSDTDDNDNDNDYDDDIENDDDDDKPCRNGLPSPAHPLQAPSLGLVLHLKVFIIIIIILMI